ncbi:hypothetical protein TrRE_jg11283 [Triparma retinervis]|uniref:Uncharacterized protein n=1 Tax=Triparma retinervis TaxID=2557542 RepID=A0A9W7G6B3_9STRA|nr:hypothetical protein TrRE_jg11283 [Triparma retinervis]
MSLSPLKKTRKANPSVNLDNFTEGGPNVEDAKEIGSPRSLLVAERLGYAIHELYPIDPRKLIVKGFDNKDTLKIKFDAFEDKRAAKIQQCRDEYGICKEFTKHATLADYKKSKIKMHWCPESGDPSGKKKKTLNITKSATKSDPTAIRMMAEAAASQKSDMMAAEMLKMEAIKRRQKREIDRVIQSEATMADLQAKLLKTERIGIEQKKFTDRIKAETKKKQIKAKQNQDLLNKAKLDEEIHNRNQAAAKEMAVERRRAERERIEEIARKKRARKTEIETAEKLAAEQARTKAKFDKMERDSQIKREQMEARNLRIQESFEERKRIKAIEIREQRAKAELRIERAKKMEKDKQVNKKVVFDKKVADHIIMKRQKVEERREEVEKAAKALADKHKRQKDAYKDAMGKNEDFRMSTVKHAEDRDGYYEAVQKIVRRKQAILATHNGLRQKEVWDNVKRINHIHDAIQQQRQAAADADDDRTDTIRQAKLDLIEERKAVAHDANMRKYRVNECMEKMRIANKFTNLERELDKAMNPGKKTFTPDEAPED